MKESHRREYEKALRRNRVWLQGFLESPAYVPADLHLLVAGRLRLLLTVNRPVLIDYAEETGQELTVWSPSPADADFSELLFVLKPLVASWEPVGNAHEVPIRDYLTTHIGVTVKKTHEGTEESVPYTPRDLIAHAANKEGVAHLTLRDKPPALRYVKESTFRRGGAEVKESELRRAMRQIGEWAVKAIDHVLPSKDPGAEPRLLP